MTGDLVAVLVRCRSCPILTVYLVFTDGPNGTHFDDKDERKIRRGVPPQRPPSAHYSIQSELRAVVQQRARARARRTYVIMQPP